MRASPRLFDYNVAFLAEELVYYRVFSCGIEQDYFAYEAANALIPKRSKAAHKALYSASTNHSIRGDKYAYGRKVIKEAGISPFCFLPKDCSIDRLDNPLKLILQKLDSLGMSPTHDSDTNPDIEKTPANY